jgi:hypothetical protein
MSGVLNGIGIVVLLSFGLQPANASAENAAPAKAQAQAALREGNALLGQGRATDALMKFTDAYRLFPSPKIHYNIGQAHTLIPGHEAQAYESMSRFLNEAIDANPKLRAAAETQRQQLRPKVGLVSVVAEPADADLLVDDVNIGRASRDAPAVIGIGTHRLALEKGATVSSPQTITIAGGETSELRLALAPPVVPPPPPSIPVAIAAPPRAAAAPVAAVARPATAAPPPAVLSASASPPSPTSLPPTPERNDEAPSGDRRPLYRKPWFWGGIAAVVIAGGLTVLLVARSPDKNPTSSLGTYPSGN